jgi:hypothetical protein
MELPWDLAQLMGIMRRRSIYEQQIRMNAEWPPPTPRTKCSGEGMLAWDKFIEAEKKAREQLEERYRTPQQRNNVFFDTSIKLSFDYILKGRTGEGLCWYSKEELYAYELNELPMEDAHVDTDYEETQVKVPFYGRS